MKRFTALLCALLLVAAMPVAAFAKSSPYHPSGGGGSVTPSPSNKIETDVTASTSEETVNYFAQTQGTAAAAYATNTAVKIYDVKRTDGLKAQLILTPYAEKDTIIYEVARQEQEAAYTELKANDGALNTICSTLATKAAAAGTTVDQCHATALFDITYYTIPGQYIKSDDHGTFRLTYNADALSRFVCLMHRKNGVWSVVDNAHVAADDPTQVEFESYDFSPYAIVIYGDASIGVSTTKSPKTGDNTLLWMAQGAALLTLLAAGAGFLYRKAVR